MGSVIFTDQQQTHIPTSKAVQSRMQAIPSGRQSLKCAMLSTKCHLANGYGSQRLAGLSVGPSTAMEFPASRTLKRTGDKLHALPLVRFTCSGTFTKTTKKHPASVSSTSMVTQSTILRIVRRWLEDGNWAWGL